jgi:hypothetical protein
MAETDPQATQPDPPAKLYDVIGIPLGDTAARVVVPDDIRRMIFNAGVGNTVTLTLSGPLQSELYARGSLRSHPGGP